MSAMFSSGISKASAKGVVKQMKFSASKLGIKVSEGKDKKPPRKPTPKTAHEESKAPQPQYVDITDLPDNWDDEDFGFEMPLTPNGQLDRPANDEVNKIAVAESQVHSETQTEDCDCDTFTKTAEKITMDRGINVNIDSNGPPVATKRKRTFELIPDKEILCPKETAQAFKFFKYGGGTALSDPHVIGEGQMTTRFRMILDPKHGARIVTTAFCVGLNVEDGDTGASGAKFVGPTLEVALSEGNAHIDIK